MRRGLGDAAIVFVLALGVRLVYLNDIRSIPFFDHPPVDGRVYDAWAQRLAEGDWWGDRVFYQAPAYPYFLGLVYAAFGRDLGLAHLLQMIMGAISCVIIFLAGREIFGRVAGLAAGLILAFYAPAIFFDGIIQKAGLGLLFMSLFLYLAARCQARPRGWAFALAGVSAGLLALTWETTLLFLVVVPVWIVLRFREHAAKSRAGWIAALLGGAAAMLLPVAVRNYAVGHTFALTTSQMGTNFYIGNNPDATGLYQPLVPGRQEPEYEQHDAVELAERAAGRPLTAGEVSRYWLRRGWDFVRESPGAWLKLLAYKWTLVWNRFEAADAEDIALYAEWSPLLGLLYKLAHFGVLAPLALAGVVLSWPRRRDAVLLVALLVALAGAVAAFYVFARYRYPLVPILALFAGWAIANFGLLFGPQRGTVRPARLAVAALAAGLLAVWVNRPVLDEQRHRSVAYANLGAICASHGRADEAEHYLRRALDMHAESPIAHEHLGRLSAERGELARAAEHLSHWLALEPTAQAGHALLARVLAGQGRADQAIAHYQEALLGRPDDIELRRELAELLRATGRAEAAEYELERIALLTGAAASTQPAAGLSPANEAARLAAVGRFAEAADLYAQAAEAEPADAELHFRWAEVLAAMERFSEAVPRYLRALELNPRFADAHNNLGMIYGRLNDPQSAEKHYRLAIESAPDMLSAHYNRGTVLAHLGRFAEAAEEMQRCLDLLPAQGRADLEPRIRDRLEKFKAEAEKRR